MDRYKYIIIAVVLFGLYSEFKKRAGLAPQNNVLATYPSGVPENCKNKAKCLTVFVAPWCPVCTASQPSFFLLHQYIAEKRPEVGFGIVIGSDRPAAKTAKKAELKPIESIIDEDGSIMKNRQIHSF